MKTANATTVYQEEETTATLFVTTSFALLCFYFASAVTPKLALPNNTIQSFTHSFEFDSIRFDSIRSFSCTFIINVAVLIREEKKCTVQYVRLLPIRME